MLIRRVVTVAVMAILLSGCPSPDDDGAWESATRVVSDTIVPGETIRATIEITIDPVDVASFEYLTADLVVESTRPDAAVIGELRTDGTASLSPTSMLSRQHVLVESGLSGYRGEGEYRVSLDLVLGNQGRSTEEWQVSVNLSRYAEREGEVEVQSLAVEVVDLLREQGGWATPGPIHLEGTVGDQVAYAVSITSSVTDPGLFDVFIVEGLHDGRPGTRRAVVGAREVLWVGAFVEPKDEPISKAASCDASGCTVDLVAVFQLGTEADWWMPIVAPNPNAPPDLLKQNQVTFDVRPLGVATIRGEVAADNPGSSTLEIDAPLNTKEALVFAHVTPTRGGGPYLGELANADGHRIDPYGWFPLLCSDRCRGTVLLTWDQEGFEDSDRPLSYSGVVIGGEGSGVGAEEAPAVQVVDQSNS